MPQSPAIVPLLLFPFVFIGAWLFATLMLSALSGWIALARRYPNRPDEPELRTQHMLSGSVGAVRMNNLLRVSVCRSGVRVGLPFLFAVFAREFQVPWSEVRITRTGGRWFKSARFEFGEPGFGVMTIPARAADVLAEAAGQLWPEPRKPAPAREPTVT